MLSIGSYTEGVIFEVSEDVPPLLSASEFPIGFLNLVTSYWQWLVGTSILALLWVVVRFLIRWYYLSPIFKLVFRGPERCEISLSGSRGGSIVISTLNLSVENVGGEILSSSARNVRLEVRLKNNATEDSRSYFPIVWEQRKDDLVTEVPEINAGSKFEVRLFGYTVGDERTRIMNKGASILKHGSYDVEVVLTCREYRRPMTARFGTLRIPDDFIRVL